MALNLYSNCSTITTGCFFYNNSNLTSPVSDGKYSDGTNCYTVSGSNGEVTGVASCTPTPEYYHYSVTTYECSNNVCVLSQYSPAFGLIAFATPLTVGTYYLDGNTGYIFYTDSYYGYGNFGGLIIVNSGSNSNCSILCAV